MSIATYPRALPSPTAWCYQTPPFSQCFLCFPSDPEWYPHPQLVTGSTSLGIKVSAKIPTVSKSLQHSPLFSSDLKLCFLPHLAFLMGDRKEKTALIPSCCIQQESFSKRSGFGGTNSTYLIWPFKPSILEHQQSVPKNTIR